MTARSSVGGVLGMAELDLLAGRDRHRPQDAQTMRVAIHELRRRGYDDHTISAATGLSVEYARRVLGEPKA